MRRIPALFLGFLLAPAAFSQTLLVGFGDVPCTPNKTGIITQVLCRRPNWCVTKGIAPKWISVPSAGGTAWDTRDQVAWYSEGVNLYVSKPRPNCTSHCDCPCRILCTYPWQRMFGKKFGYITGLAYLDYGMKAANLYIATWHPVNGPFIMTFRVYAPCKIRFASACQLTTNPHYAHGGITVDRATRTLFYSLTNFQSFGGNMLYLAPYDKPCRPTCKWEIPKTCLSKPVLGAAFSGCKKILTLTDGNVSQNFFWNGMPANCAFKAGPCCKASPVKYHGIASPFCGGGIFKTEGKTTYTKTPNCRFKCPFCYAATPVYFNGPPAAGNLNFRLGVIGAPVSHPSPPAYSAFAILLLNLQGHWNPTTLPLGCNQVVIYPQIDSAFLALGALTPVGTQCHGKVEVPFPVPCAPEFCNLKVSGQWVLGTVHPTAARTQICLEFTKGFKVTF